MQVSGAVPCRRLNGDFTGFVSHNGRVIRRSVAAMYKFPRQLGRDRWMRPSPLMPASPPYRRLYKKLKANEAAHWIPRQRKNERLAADAKPDWLAGLQI